MSARPAAPSLRSRTGRSTRPAPRESPIGTTPPTMDAPHRTIDATVPPITMDHASRSRPDTTSRRVRGHTSDRGSRSRSSDRTPPAPPPCGRAGTARADVRRPERAGERHQRQLIGVDATPSHRPSVLGGGRAQRRAVGRMRPKGAPAATRLRPRRRRRVANRGFFVRSLRTSAQNFSLPRATFRAPSLFPAEWRRRESNPRPRSHRTERLRA